ncbi:MAG: signal peptidase II [Clostridia bacterium]|nr:signal peptidase II [Clostridia bacterium]
MAKKQTLLQNEKGRYSMKGSFTWGVLLFFLLVFIDQLTKALADVYFNQPDAPDSLTVIPGWIFLRIDYNDGMAYSMGANLPSWAKIGIIALTGVMMAVLAVVYFKVDKRRTFFRIALVFIVAGGVGNLIDRLYYQVWNPTPFGVRDMVDLSRLGFAVCNFADFFICGGAIALAAALLFFDKEAMWPVGKKYKALAKEAREEEERKQTQKEKDKTK